MPLIKDHNVVISHSTKPTKEFSVVIVDEADMYVEGYACLFSSKGKLKGVNLFNECERVHMMTATVTDFLRGLLEKLPAVVNTSHYYSEIKSKY